MLLPPAEQIPRVVSSWLKANRASLEVDNDAFVVADMVHGQSIANVEGILQCALNRAIGRTARGTIPVVLREDLQAGVRVVSTEHDIG